MRRKCPKCLSNADVRIILRGMPMEEPDPNIYVLGGCIVSDDAEDYVCLKCEYAFYTHKKERMLRFMATSDSIKVLYTPKPDLWQGY